jgi:hypothetical protein
VHAVEDAEERRLAAAGRADQGGDPARGHRQRDPVEDLVVAEPGGDLLGTQLREQVVDLPAHGGVQRSLLRGERGLGRDGRQHRGVVDVDLDGESGSGGKGATGLEQGGIWSKVEPVERGGDRSAARAADRSPADHFWVM